MNKYLRKCKRNESKFDKRREMKEKKQNQNELWQNFDYEITTTTAYLFGRNDRNEFFASSHFFNSISVEIHPMRS